MCCLIKVVIKGQWKAFLIWTNMLHYSLSAVALYLDEQRRRTIWKIYFLHKTLKDFSYVITHTETCFTIPYLW